MNKITKIAKLSKEMQYPRVFCFYMQIDYSGMLQLPLTSGIIWFLLCQDVAAVVQLL